MVLSNWPSIYSLMESLSQSMRQMWNLDDHVGSSNSVIGFFRSSQTPTQRRLLPQQALARSIPR